MSEDAPRGRFAAGVPGRAENTKEKEPSILIPGLATSWAVDANDKTKWIFKLRPDVKFHDGDACDAAAVKWSIERVKDVCGLRRLLMV